MRVRPVRKEEILSLFKNGIPSQETIDGYKGRSTSRGVTMFIEKHGLKWPE